MLHRNKPPYQHMFNGLGGKIEFGETADEGAIRELREESGVTIETLRVFRKLLNSQYPSNIELHVYYGVLNEDMLIDQSKAGDEGELLWIDATELLDVTRSDVAGEGNAAYFINLARIIEGV